MHTIYGQISFPGLCNYFKSIQWLPKLCTRMFIVVFLTVEIVQISINHRTDEQIKIYSNNKMLYILMRMNEPQLYHQQ